MIVGLVRVIYVRPSNLINHNFSDKYTWSLYCKVVHLFYSCIQR